MARLPRLKVESEVGWYHLCARVAGWLDWYPFEDRVAREKLLEIIRKYVAAYFCEVAGLCLMGNHYHLVVRFSGFRQVSQEELYARACRLYAYPDRVLRWPEQWQRLHRRLFDVSEFMRNVQQSYTKWYNRHYDRRGCLWGERFKSSILADEEALLNALLYVELNPVRAGLVQRPEDWRWSSAAMRVVGQDSWLMGLEELPVWSWTSESVYGEYRKLLYHRGAVAGEAGRGRTQKSFLSQEETRGFSRPGAYRRRLRFFTEGLVLGTRIQVEDWITHLQRRGYYLRRRHSIVQKVDQAIVHTLREQRKVPLRV